ncbi:uncharacterized protein [Oscarella lobularis]|uniref:uncharacterized protein n=1 Tax=Oscarella lobularis TaxID=121494 RepID=UPI0033134AC6
MGYALLLLALFAFSAHAAPLVNVSFYSEALCPYCDALTEGEMNKAVEEIGEIFTLHFVPWGNAKIEGGKRFVCQHGEIECQMNAVEACVLHYYPKRAEWWPFVVCLEAHGKEQSYEVAQTCAQKQSMEWTRIDECATGELGYNLGMMYYRETAALDPPHEYTPWLTLNGRHIEQQNLITQICDAYMGSPKPKKCSMAEEYEPILGVSMNEWN